MQAKVRVNLDNKYIAAPETGERSIEYKKLLKNILFILAKCLHVHGRNY